MDKKTVSIAATILLFFLFNFRTKIEDHKFFTAYIYANPCEE